MEEVVSRKLHWEINNCFQMMLLLIPLCLIIKLLGNELEKINFILRLNRPQRHKAYSIHCRSTNSVWIRQCGATKGRLCPNHTETELYGGQSASTKVHNDHNENILFFFCHFVCETGIIHQSLFPKRRLKTTIVL